MRKVMIIDDEKWIRRGLIQSIAWDRFGLELSGEAGDGDTAYEMAVWNKPDLIFLDMRMPGLEGKELLGLFHRELPDTITIVVSGYADFEYTKEAIRHKAFDYLLKPVKKEDLHAVLAKAVEELGHRDTLKRKDSANQGAEWLWRLLTAAGGKEEFSSSGPGALLPTGWSSAPCVVMAGWPDRYEAGMDGTEIINRVRERLERLKPFVLGGSWSFEVTADEKSRLFAVALQAGRLEAEEILRIGTEVQAEAAAVFASDRNRGRGCEVSIGISSAKPAPGRLGEACREAKDALRMRKLGESGVILMAGAKRSSGKDTYPQNKENSLLLTLQRGSIEAAMSEFLQWFAVCGGEDATIGQLQRSAVMLLHSIEKQLQVKSSSLEELTGRTSLAYAEMIGTRSDAASIRSLFAEELIPAAVRYYAQNGEKQSERIVEELKKRIESEYAQPLSLHQIAAGYYLNPDYLSRIFKKIMGTNFVDYLTDYRIGKSKELMKQSKYKNYEIAQMVGYEDYRYFSQIFKKKTGMTIGEYRSAGGLGDR